MMSSPSTVIRPSIYISPAASAGLRTIRPVAADTPLTYADVSLPAGRLVDRLYAEQQAMFAEQKVAA